MTSGSPSPDGRSPEAGPGPNQLLLVHVVGPAGSCRSEAARGIARAVDAVVLDDAIVRFAARNEDVGEVAARRLALESVLDIACQQLAAGRSVVVVSQEITRRERDYGERMAFGFDARYAVIQCPAPGPDLSVPLLTEPDGANAPAEPDLVLVAGQPLEDCVSRAVAWLR